MSTRSRLLAALIAPYLIVLAFGYRSWEGRLVSVGYLWALLGFLAVRLAVLPSKQLIGPESKLRRMRGNVIGTVLLFLRAGALAIAVFMGFNLIFYLQDVYDIVTSRHVKTITGHFTAIQYNAFTW